MKIVQITPGTGSFFCGSCLRDHDAARALRARGHDVAVLPLYLPFVLEDTAKGDAPHNRVFMGGINLYLQQKWPALAHLPGFLRNWLDRPGLLAWSARRSDMTAASELGDMTWSMIVGRDGRQAKELERFLDWLRAYERPDLIVLGNALLLGLAQPLAEALDVPIVCTLQGEDTFLDSLAQPWRDRCWSELQQRAPSVSRFVAVSRYYGDLMEDRLQLESGTVAVVHNGIDTSDFAVDRAEPPHPTIGYLARLCPDKGFDILIEAFIDLKQRATIPNLRLRAAGACVGSDATFIDQMKKRLAEAGCLDDVSIETNIDRAEKIQLLHASTVFSVPAMYGESFGLYTIEALAAGVPIVQPNHAAFPEIVQKSGGGVLCEPGDTQSLADAIETLLLDTDHRNALAESGRSVAHDYFTAERMAAELESVYADLLRSHTHTIRRAGVPVS